MILPSVNLDQASWASRQVNPYVHSHMSLGQRQARRWLCAQAYHQSPQVPNCCVVVVVAVMVVAVAVVVVVVAVVVVVVCVWW